MSVVGRLLAALLTALILASSLLAVPSGAAADPGSPPAPEAPEEPDEPDEPEEPVPPVVSDIRMVHANIYTGLSVEKFQKDVATVLSLQPDFVTYNEVPFRNDLVMAPEGYDIWRDMRDRFTAATPVAWRSDRWTAIDQGVHRISNWRGKPPGREIELGRRYANWVTLQGIDGRVLSVVSIHVAPVAKGMPDLLRRSVSNLGTLTDELSPRGPVLVGGDVNVHYTSGRYPRDLLTTHALVPTYDSMGGFFPTGDHHGYTIDYVLNRGSEQLEVDEHFPVELKSDHDAVVAGFSWTTDLPTGSTEVRSDPDGDLAARRAVLNALSAGIRTTPAGATVRLVTSRADLFAVRSRLLAAARRGAVVQVSVTSGTLSSAEAKLSRQLAEAASPSWVRPCGASCGQEWAAAGGPRSLMLVGDPAGSWTARYDTGRALTRALVQRPTRLVVSAADTSLQEADALVRRLG